MRVLVAGATGAVGRRLVPLLQEAGHGVTAISRSSEGTRWLRAQGAEAVQANIFDADSVHRAVADAAPDAVIHQLTALSGGNPADHRRIRREGTRILVDAAKRAGVARILAQSIAWAYEPGDTPANEDTPFDVTAAMPRAAVVAAIQALEETVAEIDDHVFLRYGTFYGPGTWYALGGPFAAQLRAGGPTDDPAAVFLSRIAANDAVSSFIHLEDAARAAVDALEWPSGAVNIVDDEPARGREW